MTFSGCFNSFCGAMLCTSAAYAVMRCLCVCPSVTFVSCVKTNKDMFEFFSPSGSQAIPVFLYQTGCHIPTEPPPNGGVECGWGRQKAPFWTNIVVYTRRRRSVCDGLDVIRRKRKSTHPPPDTTLLVITPFSTAVGHRRTEPGGYFCWKLTLTRSPDPIRPTRRGPGPNRLT